MLHAALPLSVAPRRRPGPQGPIRRYPVDIPARLPHSFARTKDRGATVAPRRPTPELSRERAMGIGMTILLAVIVVIVLWAAGSFNALVGLRNRFRNAFAQIDVQLKRRYDLIPNLVETAKGYLAHERQTLDAVVAARSAASATRARAAANPGDQGAVKQLAVDDAALTGALGRLFAVAEAYPDLKANVNMMQLSEELTTTENKVSFARQAYNDAVMTYNTRVESFPGNLIAGLFAFRPADLWQLEAAAEERQAVKVSFS